MNIAPPDFPAPTKAKLPEQIPATFTGTTIGYYPIFITNIFLTLITIGIYSPWAKVRERRFFYGHTSFAGKTFDFDAKPFAIFLARVLIGGFLIGVLSLEKSWDLVLGEYGFGFLLFVLILPLLLVRGRAFNARHTLLSGMRFRYAKRFLPSYLYLFCFSIPHLVTIGLLSSTLTNNGTLPWPLSDWTGGLLVAVLLYAHFFVLWPISHWWAHRIRINQLEFGKLHCHFASHWHAYAKVGLIHLLLLALLWGGSTWQILKHATEPELPYQHMFFLLPGSLFIVLSYLAHINWHYWNGIAFADGSRLQASFNPFVFAYWITLINLFLKTVSLGLLTPYTSTRRWQFLTRNITFIPSSELREVLVSSTSFETAIGSEALDLDGFDFDLAMI